MGIKRRRGLAMAAGTKTSRGMLWILLAPYHHSDFVLSVGQIVTARCVRDNLAVTLLKLSLKILGVRMERWKIATV